MKVIIVTKAADLYYSEMIEIHDVIQITTEQVFNDLLLEIVSAQPYSSGALGDAECKTCRELGSNPRILRIYQHSIDRMTITDDK